VAASRPAMKCRHLKKEGSRGWNPYHLRIYSDRISTIAMSPKKIPSRVHSITSLIFGKPDGGSTRDGPIEIGAGYFRWVHHNLMHIVRLNTPLNNLNLFLLRKCFHAISDFIATCPPYILCRYLGTQTICYWQ
jgi:hypothetical protein